MMSYEELGLQSARVFFKVREQYNRQVRADIKEQIMDGLIVKFQKQIKFIKHQARVVMQ